MSEDHVERVAQFGFDCPECGETNVVETENGAGEIQNRIFECVGCGENILLDNYRGEKDE